MYINKRQFIYVISVVFYDCTYVGVFKKGVRQSTMLYFPSLHTAKTLPNDRQSQLFKTSKTLAALVLGFTSTYSRWPV